MMVKFTKHVCTEFYIILKILNLYIWLKLPKLVFWGFGFFFFVF